MQIFYCHCYSLAGNVQAKLDALPDETEVVISARVDKSGRMRPERTESEKKRDDIEALVRAEREDLGNQSYLENVLFYILGDSMRVSEAALMKAAAKNIVRGGGLDELFEGTAKRGAKREKFGQEDENDRKRSKQIHK